MSALTVFAATFVCVFALGLQSLNVNHGQYLAAALTSFFISEAHLRLYEILSHPSGPERYAYIAGGITGITASMWFHRRVRTWWTERSARARLRHAISAKQKKVDEHAAPYDRTGRYGR